MSLTATMLAAASRLLTYYNGNEKTAENPGGMTGPNGMAENWDPCIRDIGAIANGVGGVLTATQASETNAAGSATAAAGSAALAAADRATGQTLLTQSQAARDASAASAALSQQWVGASTNVIVPANSHRLASAWDANGVATAYTLAGVVATHRYDTRQDWDFGAWRKGKLARASSWWNESLNTSTRGAKREFPVVALIVATATQVIIYDAHDLDANGSPRMWMVFTRGGSFTSFTNNTLWMISVGSSTRAAKMKLGQLELVGQGIGRVSINFLRDRAIFHTESVRKVFGGNISERNTGKGYTQDIAEVGFLVHYDSTDVDLRVLPGAPLDPMSRLPIPTIAVATAGGVSVIHPTGMVASVGTGETNAYACVSLTADGLIYAGRSSGTVRVFRLPYANSTTGWDHYLSAATAPGIIPAGSGSTVLLASDRAFGTAVGLTLYAPDRGNPANSMASYVTKEYATGWMPGDTRLAAICEGAGSGSTLTGSGELIPNGDGASATGWTGFNGGIPSVSGGKLRVTATAGQNDGYIYRDIALPADTSVLLTLDISTTAGSAYVDLYDTASATALNTTVVAAGQSVTGRLLQFTTKSASVRIRLFSTNGGQSVDYKVSGKLAIPDRSFKAKGLIVTGTLTRAPVATGSEICSISGFGAGKYLTLPYTPDHEYGTGDLCIAMWHRAPSGSGWPIYHANATGSGAWWRVGHNASGASFIVSDGTNSATTSTTTGFSDGAWHLGQFIIRASTKKAEYWLDGTLIQTADASALGSINNPTAYTNIGASFDGSSPSASAELALVRIGGYAPSPAQIRRMYADESTLFQPGGKAFLGGTSNSVQALALDEDNGVLSVATADGVDQFAGLRRVAHLAPAAGTAFTAASVTSLSAGRGALLIGTASEAGVVTELQPIKDELRQMPTAANSTDIVLGGVTSDATPLDLGKVFVGEAESVQIEADVQATEYGQTPTEGASYTVRARVRRNMGGSVTLVGSVYHVTVDETTSTMDATVAVDAAAQAFSITVIGKSSARLIWRARLRLNWIGETRNAA